MIKIVGSIVLIILIISLTRCDQLKEPYKEPTYFSYTVQPQSTDAAITTTTLFHYATLNTRLTLQGKLFIFLGSTASRAENYSLLIKTATSLGYHVINLSYLNAVDEQVCKDKNDLACFTNYHEEMIFGGKQSELVDISVANSINNRIIKLLHYLQKLNPHDGWSQFYEGPDLIYSKIVLAGHGQGGGHVAYLAQKFAVDRLVLFSSPNDYSNVFIQPATWCKDKFATTSDRFYSLVHKRDDVLDLVKQYAIWKSMGLLDETDTSSADLSNYSSFHALVTHQIPNPTAKALPLYRNATAQDYALPIGADREQLKQVWLYLMGSSGR